MVASVVRATPAASFFIDMIIPLIPLDD